MSGNNEIASTIKAGSASTIGKFAFANKRLSTVTIPEGTTCISEGAFFSNNLSEVIVPASVMFIEKQAFAGNNLERITIGSNVSVQDDSFRYHFDDYYRRNGYKAGTYILKAGHWNFNGIEPAHKTDR
jgi:hypothetical protein